MNRALRILALCALVYSVLQVWYSLTSLDKTQVAVSLVSQVLRTTSVALGLATAVVALVAAAEERRWRRVAVFGFLAVLTPYGGYLIEELYVLAPALNPWFETEGLLLFMLSYTVPTIATALVILAGNILPKAGRPHLSEAPDDALEIHYSSIES